MHVPDIAKLWADGAIHVPGLLDVAGVEALRTVLAPLPTEGSRPHLYGLAALRSLLGPNGVVGRLAATLLDGECSPISVRLFDKTPQNNWAVDWHQDRSGPVSMLSGMITIRLHLDDVDVDNAPLLYVMGSHRLGWLSACAIPDVVEQQSKAVCLAMMGDAWAYATLVLHASEPAARVNRRRVLHADYARLPLPASLDWLAM